MIRGADGFDGSQIRYRVVRAFSDVQHRTCELRHRVKFRSRRSGHGCWTDSSDLVQKESERPPDAVPLPDRRGSPASATGRRQELPKVLGFTTTKHVLKVIQSTWLCSTEIKDRKGQEHNPSHGDQGGRQAGDSERLSRRFRRRKPVTYRFSNMWGMFSASLRPDYVSGYGS
jgi:hypothetical protein